ncbi:MAG: DUF1566 domain-containing protein [Deltaproteobacteria bacterium]|nr:DUF1566 domain-containing protein [Deltaproteobacteria bacterium]
MGTTTGTLAKQAVSNATVSQAAGYYSAFNLSTVDTNLATANIKSGVSIFGVAGKPEVVDTAGATAVPGDILTGKTAFVGGSQVTGTVTAGGNVTGVNGAQTITVPDGLYTGSKTATAIDTNLVASNIKCGVTIFGVKGTAESTDGRYIDHCDGTVTDVATGLMWTQNANLGGVMTWVDAVAYCNNMNAGAGTYGYTGWRLPSVQQQDGPSGPMGKPELDTLGRPGGIPGAMPYSMPGAPFFTGVQPGCYWSGTTFNVFTDFACVVDLYDGDVVVSGKTGATFVWPVRAG